MNSGKRFQVIAAHPAWNRGDTFLARVPWLAALVSGLLVLSTLFLFTYRTGPVRAELSHYYPGASQPSFMDTRTITHSLDCVNAGENPYVVHRFDPWGNGYDYPSIWLQLRHLGIDSRSSDWMGWLFAGLQIAACVWLLRARTLEVAAYVFLCVASYPMLFILERGNCDEVIFALLVCGSLLLDRVRPMWMFGLRTLLIAALTVLKVFPVVAALTELRARRGPVRAAVTIAVSVGMLLLVDGLSFRTAVQNVPHPAALSFGAYSTMAMVSRWLPAGYRQYLLAHAAGAAMVQVVVLSLLGAAIALLAADGPRSWQPDLNGYGGRGTLALSGLLIYCGAFAAMSSFGYRLVFLLLPAAVLIQEVQAKRNWRTAAVLSGLLFYLDSPYLNLHLQDALGPIVFAWCVVWLVRSALSNTESVWVRRILGRLNDPAGRAALWQTGSVATAVD